MPIHDHQLKEGPPCPCCGDPTITSSGMVETPDGSGFLYVARWNPESHADGIMFLIGLGDLPGFVSVRFDFDLGGFNVVEPGDYDWQSFGTLVMPRDQVSGTPLARIVFRVIDEVWLNDPDLIGFVFGDHIPEEVMRDGLVALGHYSRAEAIKLLDALEQAGIAASGDFFQHGEVGIFVDPDRRAEAEGIHERVLGWKLSFEGHPGEAH